MTVNAHESRCMERIAGSRGEHPAEKYFSLTNKEFSTSSRTRLLTCMLPKW